MADDQLADIPDDVRELIAPHLDPPEETLDAICTVLTQKRDDAKMARGGSGIETVWNEAEESYIGIDDANRGEFSNAKWAKPMSTTGPVTAGKTVPTVSDTRSTAFVRITARYVDAGVAKLCEILLPPDDKSFSITETPLPELIKASKDKSQVLHSGLNNTPLTRDAKPEEVPPAGPAPGAPMMAPMTGAATGGSTATAPASASAVAPSPATTGAGGAVSPAPVGAPQVPLTVADLAEEAIQMARAKAKLAETRIWDWMVESQYTMEMRKVVFDSARLGVGVVKGPYPNSKRSMAVTKSTSGDGITLAIEDKISPAVCWVDPWNIFPDPSCGEDIHNGDHVFERDFLSESQIRGLMKLPGYIVAALQRAMEVGPTNNIASQDNSGNPGKLTPNTLRQGRYEVWYFYGMITRAELLQISTAGSNPITKDDVAENQEMVHVIATLIGDELVRAVINPLDSGRFPYNLMPWQRRAGHWAGIGIAEQIRMPQRTVNAAVRAMLNNAGKSAGSQVVINHASIRPADGKWPLTPDKIWFKTNDDAGMSVDDAFAIHEIPNVTDQMMKIVDFGMKQAEEATSIPLVTQGQSGATTPDTFGATQLQDNNANQLLRTIGYTFDDNVTEPLVRDFYEWLLLDPDVPGEEKGDFQINAHGSSALVERAIQDQTLVQMLNVSLNPAYGIDPKRVSKLWIKSKRLNPVDVQFSEQEQAAMAKAPPPVPVPVQVATIQASAVRDGLVAKQGSDQQNIQHEMQLHQDEMALSGQDQQNDAARIAAENQKTQTEATIKLHEQETRRQIAMLEYANRNGISLNQAKAELAKTAMTLQAQRDLNAADNAVELHKHHNPQQTGPNPKQAPRKPQPSRSAAKPLAQVPGRAANGKSFEQG